MSETDDGTPEEPARGGAKRWLLFAAVFVAAVAAFAWTSARPRTPPDHLWVRLSTPCPCGVTDCTGPVVPDQVDKFVDLRDDFAATLHDGGILLRDRPRWVFSRLGATVEGWLANGRSHVYLPSRDEREAEGFTWTRCVLDDVP